jgi:ribosomal protein L11 methyltransferase
VVQSWLQVSIRAGVRDLDALSDFVIERGSPGVVIKRGGIDAFFPSSRRNAALRRDLRRFVADRLRAAPRVEWKRVRPENWQHSWKRFIKPSRVGKSFWVTPPWLTPPRFRRRRVITIEPGMAFGTGTHGTTRACMEFLEVVRDRVGANKFQVLDVGTGSGILAITAALLGATKVCAIDNDPVALEVAAENLRANGVAEKILLSDKHLSAIQQRFTVVVANLTAETIDDLAAGLQKRLASNGYLILSGLLHRQAPAIARRIAGNFRVLERRRKREWTSLLLRRKN